MPYLLESPPNPTTIDEVRRQISEELADDLSKLKLNSEGFTEDDYLALNGNYRVEFIDGCIQVLPMADALHNMLVYMLMTLLHEWRDGHDVGGRFQMAVFKVKLRDGQYREPDVAYTLAQNAARAGRRWWQGADVAIEVVSSGNRDHDYITKRREYAQHGIGEYWIVDPELNQILVLTLVGQAYAEHGSFKRGDVATSALLHGLAVDVAKLLDDAAREAGEA